MKKILSTSICVLFILSALLLASCGRNSADESPIADKADSEITLTDPTPEVTSPEGAPALTEQATVSGGLSMAKIFADGMVLQRQMPIGIFGYANAGSTVTVTLGEQTGTAIADQSGEWKLDLPAMEAVKGLTLTVTCGSESLSFGNVDIGEVLVMSGQSNAQYSAYKLEDWDDIAKLADTYRNIRLFVEPSKYEILPHKYGYGCWIEATRTNLENHPDAATKFNSSAIGYVMATRLAEELGPDITIAVINVSRSGSPIVAWLPGEEIIVDDVVSESEKKIYDDILAFWEKHGRWPTNTTEDKAECPSYQPAKTNKFYQYCPTVCYNTMIAPLKGYTARGVVWYQGESDVLVRSRYAGKFEALKRSYSNAFNNEDIPFFVIQLAPYNDNLSKLAEFEAIQYDLAINNENTYVVSTGLEGTPFHALDVVHGPAPSVVHSSRKAPVAMRVADRILVELFGKDDAVLTAPELKGVTMVGNTVVLEFDTELRLLYGLAPTDFEIYDSTSSAWVKVTATISDSTKIVLNTEGYTPTQVRYGFGGRYIELATGELLDLNVGDRLAMSDDGEHFVYTASNGKIYKFVSEDGQVVRTIKSGNLTNASGEPMPTFIVTIGQNS